MTRLLPLGIVLILVVTACGSGSHAPRVEHLSVHLAATRHLTTADNVRAANRTAARLLSRLVLPPGSVQLRAEPAGDGGLLRTGWNGWSGDGDRHRFWRIHAPLDSVLAFVKAHLAVRVAEAEPPLGGGSWPVGPESSCFHRSLFACGSAFS